VGDYLFNMPEQRSSYQDTIHISYLKKQGISTIIQNTSIEELDPEHYKFLEQPLPDLCADRIQYILHTALLFHKISQGDIGRFMKDLRFENERWYLTSTKSARLIADLSVEFTKEFWGSAWNFVLNTLFKEMLKEALRLKVITLDHIHYGTDKEILSVFKKANSEYIKKRFNMCRSVHFSYRLAKEKETPDYVYHRKNRSLDPLVMTKKGLKRLTEIDKEYEKIFRDIATESAEGMKIVLVFP
ncbi:MAG: hypothetical protein ACTSXG_02375, partial [Alphaproteobacteria bacterium]